MTIEKRNKKYRIRMMVDGVLYSKTIDYKPTKTEAIQLMNKVVSEERKDNKKFIYLAKNYIEVKSNVLSPSTLYTYKKMINYIDKDFLNMRIDKIKNNILQKTINLISENHSPKTTSNIYGFIVSVLKLNNTEYNYQATLPQKIKSDVYMPTQEEVEKLLAYTKNTDYEVPIKLGLCGLRKSEIIALTMDDILDGRIRVNKAKVMDMNCQYVLKTTKTIGSTRDVIVPKGLTDLIKNKGYIYNRPIRNIGIYLSSALDNLGIKRFSFHKLRHYYSSFLHSLNVPDKYIMEQCGWTSDKALKDIYTHTLADKREKLLKESTNELQKMLG